MKSITIIARTLFPVAARKPASRPRRSGSGRSGLLQPMLALCFAATPLVILIDAMAQTA